MSCELSPYVSHDEEAGSAHSHGYKDKNLGLTQHSYTINASGGFRLEMHPLSLCVTVLWIGFVIGMLFDLEMAVSSATSSLVQPWYYKSLPGILLTIFAQGHVAITAMHLSRLAVSALHFSVTSPNTWAELFWLADNSWQGPIGFLGAVRGMLGLRKRASLTFFLFTFTCAVALVTPVFLARGYPETSLIVDIQTIFNPNTASVARMASVDAYAQLASGSGAWSTGRSVLSLYNSSTYTPAGRPRDEILDDFFFAGDTELFDTRLPGIRSQGHCYAAEDHHDISNGDSHSRFISSCNALKWLPDSSHHENLTTTNVTKQASSVSTDFCANISQTFTPWDGVPDANSTSATMSAMFWISANNASFSGSDVPKHISQGIIFCNHTISFGRASLNGTTGTFEAFIMEELLSANTSQGGEPVLHPLVAILQTWSDMSESPGSAVAIDTRAAAWYTQMGYNTSYVGGGEISINQPDLGEFAIHLGFGVTHMVNSIVLLSTTTEESYPATQHITITARTRQHSIVKVAYVLLVLWLVLLTFLSGRMYRPTFGDSLNSYVAARLLADQPELVEGYCCGSIIDNPNMKADFARVGDSVFGVDVGHVTVGGFGNLTSDRRYAGRN
ncbi:hypothetical protein VKT23_000464 [Stygiomarasmius scandens]|uniref:Uncharacterized protein n=1 Tax=Marasmiellus scandens TaxID=2682957 RepID=A0ABR1K565_9AGAR